MNSGDQFLPVKLSITKRSHKKKRINKEKFELLLDGVVQCVSFQVSEGTKKHIIFLQTVLSFAVQHVENKLHLNYSS